MTPPATSTLNLSGNGGTHMKVMGVRSTRVYTIAKNEYKGFEGILSLEELLAKSVGLTLSQLLTPSQLLNRGHRIVQNVANARRSVLNRSRLRMD